MPLEGCVRWNSWRHENPWGLVAPVASALVHGLRGRAHTSVRGSLAPQCVHLLPPSQPQRGARTPRTPRRPSPPHLSSSSPSPSSLRPPSRRGTERAGQLASPGSLVGGLPVLVCGERHQTRPPSPRSSLPPAWSEPRLNSPQKSVIANRCRGKTREPSTPDTARVVTPRGRPGTLPKRRAACTRALVHALRPRRSALSLLGDARREGGQRDAGPVLGDVAEDAARSKQVREVAQLKKLCTREGGGEGNSITHHVASSRLTPSWRRCACASRGAPELRRLGPNNEDERSAKHAHGLGCPRALPVGKRAT